MTDSHKIRAVVDRMADRAGVAPEMLRELAIDYACALLGESGESGTSSAAVILLSQIREEQATYKVVGFNREPFRADPNAFRVEHGDVTAAMIAAGQERLTQYDAVARTFTTTDVTWYSPPCEHHAGREKQAIPVLPFDTSDADQPAKQTEVTCASCGDEHRRWHAGLERFVMCTQCPTPCRECAADEGRGAYCATTPCACECHKRSAR